MRRKLGLDDCIWRPTRFAYRLHAVSRGQFDCYRRFRDALVDFCISCGDVFREHVAIDNLRRLKATPLEPFNSAHIKMLFGLCSAIVFTEDAWNRSRDFAEGPEPLVRGNRVSRVIQSVSEEARAESNDGLRNELFRRLESQDADAEVFARRRLFTRRKSVRSESQDADAEVLASACEPIGRNQHDGRALTGSGTTEVSRSGATERSPDARRSGPSILVLGMHRSGTSALTGALGLCGAWVGEERELTGANIENPCGFWERRDVRQICDRLLRTAGADWWKVTNFDPEGIPHAVLAEERTRFAKVISSLDERGTWVLKEPRLCLLLPALRELVSNCVCLHIVRNPLEVARSLKVRNGFSISGGLALWETYNRHAVGGSENLPRVLVSHESLMLHPVETLDRIIGRLGELGVTGLERPDEERLRQFISPSLYRNRATEKEVFEYLSPSQRAIWRQLCEDQAGDHRGSVPISQVSRQSLLDLESTEHSLKHHRARARELSEALSAHHRSVVALRRETCRLNAALRGRDAAIAVRTRRSGHGMSRSGTGCHDQGSGGEDSRVAGVDELESDRPPSQCVDEMPVAPEKHSASVPVDVLDLHRPVPAGGQSRLSVLRTVCPFRVDRLTPKWFREYAKLALSVSNVDVTDEMDKSERVSLSGTRRLVRRRRNRSGTVICRVPFPNGETCTPGLPMTRRSPGAQS